VHEGPHRISKVGNTVALQPGMIVSNEPGYYKTGGYGIRIENLQVVTPAADIPGGERPMLGFEALTLAPIDRLLVAKDLLTAEEIAQLDAYHARVLQVIGPQLDGAAKAWLEEVCAPL
jgi:Xaa-Pro aminopeptidase